MDNKNASSSLRVEFQRIKAKLYQEVLGTIFAKARQASQTGRIWRFGDGRVRKAHPIILIKSVDLQEAWNLCGTRAFPANHPCTKCLVPIDELHNLSARYELRTQENMTRVRDQVKAEPRVTYKESLLRAAGLHDIDVR
jgi:hypothetical protein